MHVSTLSGAQGYESALANICKDMQNHYLGGLHREGPRLWSSRECSMSSVNDRTVSEQFAAWSTCVVTVQERGYMVREGRALIASRGCVLSAFLQYFAQYADFASDMVSSWMMWQVTWPGSNACTTLVNIHAVLYNISGGVVPCT